jgi:phosphatidylserine decarboxylase
MGIIYRFVTSGFFLRTGLARGLTNLVGWLADRRLPAWLLHPLIRQYILKNQVDMSDFGADLHLYPTFNKFFTRPLLPGRRKQGDGITAPADGVVTAAGLFSEHRLFHVKGSDYPLQELLGKPGFDTGSFATIYLSPADYHRVHAPFDCTITAIRHLHGAVRTVNPDFLTKHPLLYCHNERVVLEGDSPHGKFFLILVGALVVARIRIGIVEGFAKGYVNESLSISLNKGDEIGLFEMGSTVVLVLESDALQHGASFTGRHVKMGGVIG